MAISVSPPISYTKSCKITALQSKSSHFSKQFAVTFRLLPFVVLLGSSADVLWLLTFPLQVTIAHCSLMGRLAQGNHILWSDTAITEALFLLSVTNCSKLWNKMVTRIWWDFFLLSTRPTYNCWWPTISRCCLWSAMLRLFADSVWSCFWFRIMSNGMLTKCHGSDFWVCGKQQNLESRVNFSQKMNQPNLCYNRFPDSALKINICNIFSKTLP